MIIEYLMKKLNDTGWRFTLLVEVQNLFGIEESKKQLNQLFKEGKIKKRDSVNGVLIELL